MAKMGKKDFSSINTENIYSSTIAEATQETPDTQEISKARKERVTYSEQEAADFLQSMRTAGRKGVHLPRINVAFSPDVYDYVKTMSRITGQSYTEFINKIIRDHKNTHGEVYNKAVELRNSL